MEKNLENFKEYIKRCGFNEEEQKYLIEIYERLNNKENIE